MVISLCALTHTVALENFVLKTDLAVYIVLSTMLYLSFIVMENSDMQFDKNVFCSSRPLPAELINVAKWPKPIAEMAHSCQSDTTVCLDEQWPRPEG